MRLRRNAPTFTHVPVVKDAVQDHLKSKNNNPILDPNNHFKKNQLEKRLLYTASSNYFNTAWCFPVASIEQMAE